MKRLVFIFTVLTTCILFAQDKRPSPNQRIVHFLSRPGIAESIGLPQEKIDAIKKQIEPLQAEQLKLMEEVRGKIRENYQEASDILTKPEADPGKLIAQAEETGRIRTRLAVLEIKKLVVIRDNLTPEQTKALLTKMKEEMPPPNRFGKQAQRRPQGPGKEQGPPDEGHPKGEMPPPPDGPRPDGGPMGQQPPPPNGQFPNDPR